MMWYRQAAIMPSAWIKRMHPHKMPSTLDAFIVQISCVSLFGVAHWRPGWSGFHIYLHDVWEFANLLYTLHHVENTTRHCTRASCKSVCFYSVSRDWSMSIRNGFCQDFANKMLIKPVFTQRVWKFAWDVVRICTYYDTCSNCRPDCL